MRAPPRGLLLASLPFLPLAPLLPPAAPVRADGAEGPSVARLWNEELLEAIRHDRARPVVHARNLYHLSAAAWDAWAAYDGEAATLLHHERAAAPDREAAREEAISYAAHRILSARFASSPGKEGTLARLDARMASLGFDPGVTGLEGDGPAALGNRIAARVLALGLADGSNEEGDHANLLYEPVNPVLLPALPGNPGLLDPNRWQPLSLEYYVDQNGIPAPTGTPEFLGAEWGAVTPFALSGRDRTVVERDGASFTLHHDPGPPPRFGGAGDAEYRAMFLQVVEWSGRLDPADGALLDISPASIGGNTPGTNDGHGHPVNPATGLPYAPQVVPAGDYYRCLAEFWADGPQSETPPGHWFVIANQVSDHPALVRRIGGAGPAVGRLEWDVKLHLALGGAMHDAAVAAWGVKGAYDFIRPVSALRWMAGRGQSSDPSGPSFHPDGIPLEPGVVEVITAASAAPGERHAHLAGEGGANVGRIAFRAWRGPYAVEDPETSTAGVGWILGEEWWPYQRPTFVTPPFAAYVSGHSTFSRAAARVLELFTGDPFFPGGIGEFRAPRDAFLVFEEGPSVDVTLQWATFADAADECSLSRIHGGIHPRGDDVPGRLMGQVIGPDAFELAAALWRPSPSLEIAKARVGRARRGAATVRFSGRIVPGEGDPAGDLDVTRGAEVRVLGAGGLLGGGAVEEGGCRVSRSGRIAGRSLDGSVRIRCVPSRREPGAFDFRASLRIPEAAAAAGPLTLHLRAGRRVLAGTAD